MPTVWLPLPNLKVLLFLLPEGVATTSVGVAMGLLLLLLLQSLSLSCCRDMTPDKRLDAFASTTGEWGD